MLRLPAEASLLLPEATDDGGGWPPPGGVEPPDELPVDVPLLLEDEDPAGTVPAPECTATSEPLDPSPGAPPDGGVPALLPHAIGPSASAKTIPIFNCPYRIELSCR